MEKDSSYFAVGISTNGKVFAEIGRVADHRSCCQAHTYG